MKKIKRKKGASKSAPAQEPRRLDVDLKELKDIIEATASSPLGAKQREKLTAAVETLAFLTQELEAKGASIQRLRKMIFGATTEKLSNVFPDAADAADGTPPSAEAGSVEPTADGAPGDADVNGQGTAAKPKAKGHGRNGAAAYTGAQKVKIPHESLRPGDPCPEAECDGKVYPLAEPQVLVRVRGIAPLKATVYELDRLRCNLCGEVFSAAAPPGVGDAKYDETAAAMIGLLKYGSGVPFNRLERLQKAMGIPLPASTQWEVVARAAEQLIPAYRELIRQAAQGDLLHNDDTTARILEMMGEARTDAPSDEDSPDRTGLFTTGIVSVLDGRRIALFLTGRKHAGENLADVLAQRAAELAPPIQMCDALSRNTSGDFETIVAHCNAHARRNFVEVADYFPEECRHVLDILGNVYHNDAVAREQGMTPQDRLAFHQACSAPLMDDLKRWLDAQFAEHRVEPNSGLGNAIKYMRKHWDKLALFLQRPGVPLDNTIVERSLKKVILHRKNALFFKTKNGATVGDLYMSLIHTAELLAVNPFDYLVELQRHAPDVAAHAERWMPWNYTKTLASLQSGSAAPP